jgi:hypothetical protein
MIVAMTNAMTATTTGVMTVVAKTTTIATTTTARSVHHHHCRKGQPQWCVPNHQPRNQLHHRRSPSDQKQQVATIKRKRDRAP